jgi:hypothetical protein
VPTGAAYRYYFAVEDLTCEDGATELIVTTHRRKIDVPCSARTAFATGPLAPSAAYNVTSQAVQVKHGRVVKRGSPITTTLNMPGPGDRWIIVKGLPGTPPS